MAEPRRGLPRNPGEAPAPSPVSGPAETASGAEARLEAPAEVTPAGAAPSAPSGRRGLPRPGADAPAPASAAATPAVAAAPRAESAPPAESASPAPAAAAAEGGLMARVRGWRWGVIVPVAIGAVVLGVIVVLLVRGFLYATDAGRDFLADYPGTTPLPAWAPEGIPVWLNWSHFLNAFFILLVAKTGWMVRTTKRPAAMWAPKRSKTPRKISIELFTHLSLDVLWIANGIVFLVLLFVSGQFIRIVPYSWEMFPNALSAGLQYASLQWPVEHGWVNYNSLQVLMYFLTVFVAAPLAAVTGIRMSPLWPQRPAALSKLYPVEVARAIHFPVMLYFVAFTIVHVVLVLSTGALANLNHMFASQDAVNWWGFGIFMVALAVMALGWVLVRPFMMKQFGALFGKVGR